MAARRKQERRGRRALSRMALAFVTAGVAIVILSATILLVHPTPATAQVCTPNSASTGLAAGQCAPNFTLDDLSGKPISLAAYRGHPVLLHFWAVACTNCAAEYSDFQRIVHMYGPKGLNVLAVDAWGEPQPMIQGWQNSHHLPAAILVDIPTAVATLYDGTGTPTTYYIDRDGRVAASVKGTQSYDDFRQNLARIM